MPFSYRRFSFASLVVALFIITSCKDEPKVFETPQIPVVPPETYEFENVSFSGQTDRLNQLTELMAYIETANDSGVGLDINVMRSMFENTNEDGDGNFTFTSSKQLKDKCFEPDQSTIDEYFVKVAEISLSTDSGSNGVAGRVESAGKTALRLFDENGWEYDQMIEKTLMGAIFYYQATSYYLTPEQLDVDNEEVEEGKGTEMQHHWDEAYGYAGVTVNFPNNTEDVRYWGKYCVGRDPFLGSVEALSEAFRRGRQAILVKRYDVRDDARDDVRTAWEHVCAATAIHYLNGAMDDLDDDFVRNHDLSEAYAFVQCLKYNEEKSITNGQIEEVLSLIGENFYEATLDNLTAARERLAEVYEMKGIKTQL